MKRIFGCCFILSILIILLNGCGQKSELQAKEEKTISEEESSSKEEANTSTELTQRQKDILKQMGLPQDVSQLKGTQETYINTIEECFQYIEARHPDDKFDFVEFYGYDVMSGDMSQTLVVSSEKLKDASNVTISVVYDNDSKKDRYYDDYDIIVANKNYSDDIVSYVKAKKPNAQIITGMTIYETLGEDENISNLDKWIGGIALIMTNVFEDKEDINSLMKETAGHLQDKYGDKAGEFDIIVLRDEDFKNATADDYLSDYIFKQKARYIYYYSCELDKNGELVIKGKE